MAGKSLGTLTLDLVARVGGFVQGMDAAERKSAKWRKQVERDMKAAGKVMGVALAAGATAAAAGLVMVVNRQRELIDQQAKLAQRYRTTYESISTLTRAGDLAGVTIGQIETASKGLEQRLGQAIQGTDAQKEAFDRLGLSAQEIAKLPLDKRISEINKALRENVQASERAAVAGKIFGEEGAITMQALNPETIAEAARQVEVFGLNLSDVDAAKVEMANDAMSTFGMLADGAGKQLTVELAPILKAVGDLFLEGAEEAGGMGEVIEDAANKAVNALAFVMDAGDGIKRAFTVIADVIIGTLVTAQYRSLELVAAISESLNNLPGVEIDTSGMNASAREARLIAQEAAASIGEALNEPLAGQRFKQFVEKAREEGQVAAEAVVASRKEVELLGDAYEDTGDEAEKAAKKAAEKIGGQITAMERALVTWGMTSDEVALYGLKVDGASASQLAYAESLLATVTALEQQKEATEEAAEAQKEVNTEAQGIADSLLSEEEAILSSYERRRKIILDNTEITGEAQNELLRRLEEKRSEDLLEINGSYWERYLEAAEESMMNFDEITGDMLEQFSSRAGAAFESMIFDAQTLEEAVGGMAESMARSIVNAIGQMIAQWLAYQAVQMVAGKTTQASAAATLTANASATSL